MRLDSFKSFLQDVCVQSHVATFENESSESFRAVVYCKLSGVGSYDDQCLAFIKEFSSETQTNWISLRRCANQVRYLFRKTFSCHLSKKNKTNKERKTQNNIRVRDKDCKARIDFKWKIVNRSTCRNDHNLKTGLNCVVNVVFDHSHPVIAADAMSYLRCTKETTELFHSYFQSGLSPVAAKQFHEIFLTESAADDYSAAVTLANAQINPTLRQIFYFHGNWKKDHQEPLLSSLDSLLEKKKVLENKGYYLGIKDETLDVAIVTPIMKRSFEEFVKYDNVVLIESSDSYSTSKLAPTMNNLFLTFVFVSSKIGALPIACVLQNSHNFQISLTLLKDTLERATGMKFNPKVIMTYDSAIQRIALQTIFPTAKILLSTSPIRQATWKWLGVAKNKVKDEDRELIMKYFQKVLRAPTTDSANEAFKELSTKVKDNPQAIKHFENRWFRKSEWGLQYRNEVVPEGIDVDDCEASVRILKDTLLHKSKGFTSPALIDLVCSPIENYHKQRLGDFASGQDDRVMSHYSKFCQTVLDADIVEVGMNEYHVCSRAGDKHVYSVNTDLAVCDCKDGKEGRYCGHLAAVEKKFNFWVATRPVLSDEERALFKKIAFGYKKVKTSNSQPSVFGQVEVKCELEEYSSDSEMPERGLASSSPLKLFNASSLVKEENMVSNKEVVSAIRNEFGRIADLLEWSSPACSSALSQFYKLLNDVRTPAQAHQLVANNVQHISCSADDV